MLPGRSALVFIEFDRRVDLCLIFTDRALFAHMSLGSNPIVHASRVVLSSFVLAGGLRRTTFRFVSTMIVGSREQRDLRCQLDQIGIPMVISIRRSAEKGWA